MLMAVAGLVSALFSRLKWPKVIGYILAGVLLSRHTWGFSLLADESSVQTIGQLGIVFLMFTMGLEFSTSEMRKIRGVAMPTALLDTGMMVWLGYTVGRTCLGWGTVASLFLGAAMCDSATTLLAKIIDEMNWNARRFVKYVIGTSVCEDIICVGVIALITGFAQGQGVSVAAVGTSLGGLAAFFLATIVFGLILVPRLLTSVAKRGDDETLLLTLLGCCFLVTYVAYRLQFSLALGAFLVGILGASSDVRVRLHRLADPLRSMFAAVFFVSIGLLVNVRACGTHLPAILMLSAVVIVGKGLNCFVGGLLTGEGIKTSAQMGFGLAQIGEFGYMVALLYITLTGKTESSMYQVVFGVSLLTTVLNPLMLRLSDPVGDWLDRHCPRRVQSLLRVYRGLKNRFFERLATTSENRRRVRAAVVELAVIGALVFAVAFALSTLNRLDWTHFSAWFEANKRLVFSQLMIVFIVVMLWPVWRIAQTLSAVIGETLVGKGEARWQVAMQNVVRLVVLTAVMGLAFLGMMMISINLAPGGLWARLALAGEILIVAAVGWRFLFRVGRRAAQRFEEALQADERLRELSREVTFTVPEDSVSRVVLAEGSPAVGENVVSLDIRARTGASVISVVRGGRTIRNVGPDLVFLPGDAVVILGDSATISAAKALLAGE